jgi:hypothetical protein
MTPSELKKLKALAETKGFLLDEMKEGDKYDQPGKFVLEGANDGIDADYLYFQTEEGVAAS